MSNFEKIALYMSGSDNESIKEITRRCRLAGFLSCVYHLVVLPDGTVQEGRPTTKVGGSITGMNPGHLCVCLVGTKATLTDAQKDFVKTYNDKEISWF